MDKVRKSNERNARESNKIRNVAKQTVLTFQEDVEEGKLDEQVSQKQNQMKVKARGDGIVTEPEHLIEEKELDYEDDLSIEGDLEVLSVDVSTEIENNDNSDCERRLVQQQSTQDEQQPSCSFQDSNNVIGNTVNATQLSGMSEDQLMNNPVLQRMMQTFFNNQFKNIQAAENTKQTGKNILGTMVPDKSKIKLIKGNE